MDLLKYHNGAFSNPRLGKWAEITNTVNSLWFVYCIYTSNINGVINANDERVPGVGYCGSDFYHLDTNFIVDPITNSCVCKSGATSVFGECIEACPSGQIKIGRTCHGGKNNGPQPDLCVGNPILAGSGNKFQNEPIWQGEGGMDFSLAYNHFDSQNTFFGKRWRSSFDKTIHTNDDGSIVIFRKNGKAIRFQKLGTVWSTDTDITDKLQEIIDINAIRTGWQYKVTLDDSIETYDASGRLASIQQRNNRAVSLQYSDGTTGVGGDVFVDTGAMGVS